MEVGCGSHGGLGEFVWESKGKKGILQILEVHQEKKIGFIKLLP